MMFRYCEPPKIPYLVWQESLCPATRAHTMAAADSEWKRADVLRVHVACEACAQLLLESSGPGLGGGGLRSEVGRPRGSPSLPSPLRS